MLGKQRASTVQDDLKTILEELNELAEPSYKAKMTHFGIVSEDAIGIPMPRLRALAKQAGRNHPLALALWDCGVHEGKTLASLMGDPASLTRTQADRMVGEFYSWDICDGFCSNLLYYAPFSHQAAIEYTYSEKEFVCRAGFTLIAVFAMRDKQMTEKELELYLGRIRETAHDERNFVKKAINWALRNLGKHSPLFCEKVIAFAENLAEEPSKSTRWIAKDALRELTSSRCYVRKNP